MGQGKTGHDDLWAMGMVEPDQEWNRLRGGTNPGRGSERGSSFVGVTVAYLNRSSPNQDLIKEFMERYALTEEGLTAMYMQSRPAFQALISIYENWLKTTRFCGSSTQW
jgi:hypothetical protein